MSNGNAEWMPLYIGDYLGDTMELDGPQHGAYLLLLMYYWRNGPLPLDDAKLAQIGRTDIRVWKKTVGPVVRAFFHERDGRLHQKRADKELAKADSISAKRRAAAEARWTNGAPPPHPNGEDANAYANASGLHPVCTTGADANGMLRAPASPVPVQSKKEPSRSPPTADAVGGLPAADAAGPLTRTRSNGLNPRKTGTNPRNLGTNPRAAAPREGYVSGGIAVLAKRLLQVAADRQPHDDDLTDERSYFSGLKVVEGGRG